MNVIKWFGGKSKIAPWLIENFPKHRCFVDVFGGAANVLLRKKRSKVEVYNDIDSDLVNLFRQIRNNYDEFVEKIQWFLYSREEFDYYQENFKNIPENSLERALAFYFMCNACFNGFSLESKNFFSCSKVCSTSFHNKIKNLHQIKKRFYSVQIEHLDYEKVVKKYDGLETFFYLDPPYIVNNNADREKYYKFDLNTEENQKKFLDFILNIKGKVMVSGYDSSIYREKLKNWKIKSKKYTKDSSNRKNEEGTIVRNTAFEYIWMNYDEKQNRSSSISSIFFE